MWQLIEGFEGKRPPTSARVLILRQIRLLTLSVSAIWFAAPVRADLITFTAGNLPPFDGVNITQGSHPVVGTVDGQQVDFTSSQSLSAPASGEAKVIAVDSKSKEIATTDLVISLDDKTQGFEKLILDAHLTKGKGGFGSGGDVYVTVKGIDKNGSAFELDNVKDPSGYSIGNGQNFLTVLANDGAFIKSVEISAAMGWTETKQVRMYSLGPLPSPPPPTHGPSGVPEPSSLAVAIFGALGLWGFKAWRRLSS
jgi:hypothetical protein